MLLEIENGKAKGVFLKRLRERRQRLHTLVPAPPQDGADDEGDELETDEEESEGTQCD